MSASATIPLVLATRNEGKIWEFKTLLKDFDVEVLSLRDFGAIPPVIEDGRTFEENAVKKARITSKALGFPSLADDSGLIVNALNGMPGVYSARYAGEQATDLENNLKLLKSLEGVTDRSAVFMCVLAIAVPAGDALIYEGTCSGSIAEVLKGDGGFGYDPVFYYTPLGRTFAELSPDEKNRVSHRGKAMAKLQKEFVKVSSWLTQRLHGTDCRS